MQSVHIHTQLVAVYRGKCLKPPRADHAVPLVRSAALQVVRRGILPTHRFYS